MNMEWGFIFADGAPSAKSIGDGVLAFGFWVSVLANLALVVGLGVSLTRKKEKRIIAPQPLEVEGELKVQSKGRRFNAGEWDAKHVEIDRRLDEHGEQIESLWSTMRAEDKESRQEFGEKIDGVRKELSGKIDELPAQMVALLRNTGAIGKH